MTVVAARPVVIGGGIAGLVAAWELARAGRCPLLLERSRAVGGPVARHTVAGIELDSGAESFAIGRPAVTDLLVDLGMADAIVPPAPMAAWVRHEGGSAALPAGALLGIPADPLADDVVAAIGVEAAAQAAALDARPVGTLPDSLGALVEARMGRQVLRRLVDPVVGGVHAADPCLLEIDAVAPGLSRAVTSSGSLAAAVRMLRGAAAPGSAVAGIDGGMAELPRALVEQIVRFGGEIRCSTAVIRVETTPSGQRVIVGDADGGQSVLISDLVVIACPASDLLDLTLIHPPANDLTALGPVLPEISRTTPVTLMTLVLDDPRLDAAPRGTGVLVSRRVREISAKALTHASVKWPWLAARLPSGRHVLRLSYGRGGSIATPDPTTVLADASALLDVEPRPEDLVGSGVVRWPSALPQARPGHLAEVRALRASLPPGLVLIGGAVAGNGLSSIVSDARVQLGPVSGC
ncbi:MAG: FAD-dependent oxidoreductase [Nakamurella sp.]